MNSSRSVYVASSVNNLLHMEVVHYIRRQCKDDSDEAMRKLSHMGFHSGQRLAERFSLDRPRFLEPLDVIKFICKELWKMLFNKHIDKLQTNYKGVYVIHDFDFAYLRCVSTSQMGDEAVKGECSYLTQFTCGMLKGVLYNLGITVSVKAEISTLPKCQFTIVDQNGTVTK